MKVSYFDKQHIKEYLLYGTLAAILFAVPVWYFLYKADYLNSWMVYSGSIFFMFVIILYCIKLSKREPEYQSTWMMVIVSHFAVLTGIVLSVILSLILCFIYIPDFMTGHSSSSFLENAPTYANPKNIGTLFQIFIPATVENFGVGGFIAVLAPYVFKRNQTKDRAAPLNEMGKAKL